MRLSPQDPHIFNMRGVIATAYLFAGRHRDAWQWAERAFQDRPDYLMGSLIYAAGKALDGQLADARRVMTRVRELDPMLRVSNLQNRYPYRRREDVAALADGLRQAGLAE